MRAHGLLGLCTLAFASIFCKALNNDSVYLMRVESGLSIAFCRRPRPPREFPDPDAHGWYSRTNVIQ